MIHQDSEIIPQVCTGEAEHPHAPYDEGIARGEEDVGNGGRERSLEKGVSRLGAESAFIARSLVGMS